MFTAAEPLLGGAIGSAVLPASSLCVWRGVAVEPLPRCFTLHSNVSERARAGGNSAFFFKRAPAAREALLSHLLGLHSAGHSFLK